MGLHYSQLGREERGVIECLRRERWTLRAIAGKLNRSPSTISREIRRHEMYAPGRPWRRVLRDYQAVRAGERAQRRGCRARRPRTLRGPLWAAVQQRLAQCWSPQEIARTLRKEHPLDPAWHVSHQTIYSAIYAMPRGELKRTLAR